VRHPPHPPCSYAPAHAFGVHYSPLNLKIVPRSLNLVDLHRKFYKLPWLACGWYKLVRQSVEMTFHPPENFLRTALCLDKLTDFMRRMQTWFILLRNRVKHYLSSREALISYRRTGCSFNLANRFDTLPKCFVIFVVYTVRLYTVYVMIY
jgi:hypothetical protein